MLKLSLYDFDGTLYHGDATRDFWRYCLTKYWRKIYKLPSQVFMIALWHANLAGLLHALVAMDLPGAGSVFVRQSWKFPKPVFIGDVITAIGTVKSVQQKRSMTEMEFSVSNQNGDVVLEGEALVYQADASE